MREIRRGPRLGFTYMKLPRYWPTASLRPAKRFTQPCRTWMNRPAGLKRIFVMYGLLRIRETTGSRAVFIGRRAAADCHEFILMTVGAPDSTQKIIEPSRSRPHAETVPNPCRLPSRELIWNNGSGLPKEIYESLQYLRQ